MTHPTQPLLGDDAGGSSSGFDLTSLIPGAQSQMMALLIPKIVQSVVGLINKTSITYNIIDVSIFSIVVLFVLIIVIGSKLSWFPQKAVNALSGVSFLLLAAAGIV